MVEKARILSMKEYIKQNKYFLDNREEISSAIMPENGKGRVLDLNKFVAKNKPKAK
jgi:hypothetical protein